MNLSISRLSLLAVVSVAAALTLSCGEKCGGKKGKSYNPKTHFCYNDSEVIAKCGGKEYDPETQTCESGAVWGKCAGMGYNPATHFCLGESAIMAKCGGKEYDPETQICQEGKVAGKCGDKGFDPETHLCDPRDSVVYRYTTIGKQAWMAENLNFNAATGARCHQGKAENCDKYGRLYTWTSAMALPNCGSGSCAGKIKEWHTGICPPGWHVPGRDEWIEMLIAAGGSRDPDSWGGSAYDGVGKKLRSKDGWSTGDGKSGNGTDELGFSALPSSSRDAAGNYGALGYNAHWWSAADYENSAAYTRYTSFKDDKVVEASDNRGASNALRCVRDPEGANVAGDSGKAASGAGSFSDSRDGRKYRTVKIGAQTWMAENLNYKGDKSAQCYGNDEQNCQKYGALYPLAAAKAACPSGWLLPTREDWKALAEAAGGDKAAGKKLKAASGWGSNGKGGNGTDELGFGALPGGTGNNGDFGKAGITGNWWSSTEKEGSGDVYYRSMTDDGDAASELSAGSFLYSIRCVQHWGSGNGLPEFKGRFGFANESGSKVIITYTPTADGVPPPRFSSPVAVGGGKAGVDLKNSPRNQQATEEDDGRQTHYNFDNLSGVLYDVSKGTLTGDGTYFISESAWFKKALLPLTSTRDTTKNGSPYKPVDAATLKRIEALKGRKAAQSELLGQAPRTGAKICLVVFKREKNDMLASLVYVDKDKTISKDFPAEYDAASSWRVDDGGEFGHNAIDVVFLATTGERIILAFKWAGPEGENAYIIREENGVFLETEFGGYRYWAPN